jgi:AcrR family transcriptional regulator
VLGTAPSPGLHTRAGNSMARTREGLLDGALATIERDGLQGLTMSKVASRSGVAKATLYNHFRTKDDLVAALLLREVALVCAAASSAAGGPAGSVTDGLDGAAAELGAHVAVRWLAKTEPAAVLPLLTPGVEPAWQLARQALADMLARDPDSTEVDVALRWLVSQLAAPQEAGPRRASAELVAAATSGP